MTDTGSAPTISGLPSLDVSLHQYIALIIESKFAFDVEYFACDLADPSDCPALVFLGEQTGAHDLTLFGLI